MSQSTRFDDLLAPNGPAALVWREYLVPVEGKDGVFFPPTYAASQDGGFKGGYAIDVFGDGRNVCAVDSVGSQANRMEPLFMRPPYAELVPQVVVTAGTKRVNLLEAGHRAADAVVRCSALKEDLRSAFVAAERGDSEPLAKIAPTSLVFGVWDSRDTQVKRPRLITSTIRAYDVQRLTRSAQYIPAVDFVAEGLLDETTDKKTKDAYAEKGFVHVPSSGVAGGVIAEGPVRRDATLHLAALRHLGAGEDKARTAALQRYLLGLALVAITASQENYLRQGCNLVRDPDMPAERVLVHPDGRRVPFEVDHTSVVEFARLAAKEFGVGSDRTVDFLTDAAKQEIAGESGSSAPKKAGSKKAAK